VRNTLSGPSRLVISRSWGKMEVVIQKIRLIKAIGQFDSVNSAAAIDLRKLTLIYAENARGKTTLVAIARSLSTGEAIPISERRRLGAPHAPEAIIECTGNTSPACFQNGSWSRTLPEVLVFDDFFVDQNVYSGLDVEAEHRQNLHELILGEAGVALARRVDDLAVQIRDHNTELRSKADAIAVTDRHGLSVDDFCGLAATPDIDDAINTSERQLTALQNAATVRSSPEFATLQFPTVDFAAVSSLLGRTVADLDQQAVDTVAEHFAALGDGAETWVATGIQYADKTSDEVGADCPFCKQSLQASEIFAHYRAYFGEAYTALQSELAEVQVKIERALNGDALAGFERQVRSADERSRSWSRYATVPEVHIDTSAVARAWQQARDAVLVAVRAKRSDPLTATSLSTDAQTKIENYETTAREVQSVSDSLAAANETVKRVKESVNTGSTSTAEVELRRLRATKARYSTANLTLCSAYLDGKTAKETAEAEKLVAQQALDTYRATVFPNYQTAINTYLSRLGAGFTIVNIESQPTGGRPSCVYCLVINGHQVPVGANTASAGSHTFKTTLSAGDRNTLALAFFLAALDQDPNRANRIVVLDDPMSSLDKHRRMATIQQIRTLLPTVAQIIVMSHDEYFLFKIYDRVAPRNAQHVVVDTTSLCVGRAPQRFNHHRVGN
jgi:wobble nucleotide-excising tRNase